MIDLFHKVSENCSKATTKGYSTSFFSSIKLLHNQLQQPIHNVYGFVRFADEIVDTFHDFDKKDLLQQFKQETYAAIDRKISLNPILNSFQITVNKYNIGHDLIEAFFTSMEYDLEKKTYTEQGYKEYIYGSAEVVGLMCLHVFCEGNLSKFNKLKSYARSLGAAFQKVNFLRDLKADKDGLGRMYFPNCNFDNFTTHQKLEIEKDIQNDFDEALKGIILLPIKSKKGVYVAYKYYLSLFKKIKQTKPELILEKRIRIPNYSKAFIVAKAGLRLQLNIL